MAVGWGSLYSDAEGSLNTAIGTGALLLNTADENTATGAGALLFNNSGTYNTANGAFALHSNTTGPNNTATGTFALFSNTEGDANTAIGSSALLDNTTGFENTAIGTNALTINSTGVANTAIGDAALGSNTTGNTNIALGFLAGLSVTTASNVTCIGASGANVDNSCYIGGIFGAGVSGGMSAVFVDSDGKLGTNFSARRFEQDIEPMEKASEAILALNPVTFHYRSDNTNTAQFGLIAEEVAEVNPDLVVRDKNGELLSVRYDAVNAMVLNEFRKARRQIDAQQKQIEALTAGLQKVSAQLEASKPAPQVVNNR